MGLNAWNWIPKSRRANRQKNYKVKFPNYEIKTMFEDMVDEWFSDK